jgi:hypothetical protein
MRLFWQYLQAYWRPLIGTFVQQPAALSASDLPVAALGMQLMEVKGVNCVTY